MGNGAESICYKRFKKKWHQNGGNEDKDDKDTIEDRQQCDCSSK